MKVSNFICKYVRVRLRKYVLMSVGMNLLK